MDRHLKRKIRPCTGLRQRTPARRGVSAKARHSAARRGVAWRGAARRGLGGATRRGAPHAGEGVLVERVELLDLHALDAHLRDELGEHAGVRLDRAPARHERLDDRLDSNFGGSTSGW